MPGIGMQGFEPPPVPVETVMFDRGADRRDGDRPITGAKHGVLSRSTCPPDGTMETHHNVKPRHQMSELHHTLETMGVLQFLFAAAFLICYTLAIGGFLGPGARAGVLMLGFIAV